MEESSSRFRLYARYLADENNVEQDKVLKQLLSDDKGYKKELRELSKFWNLSRPKINKKSKRNIARRTYNRLGITSSARNIGLTIFRYAASITLIVSIALNLYLNYQANSSGEFVQVNTTTGQVEEIELPDGSKVWLNSQSTLLYVKNLSGSERNIYLDGEAYFEVKENKKRPFNVNTTKMKVQVLGTSFNISSYGNDAYTSTLLLEGTVKIINKLDENNQAVLLPGQEGVIYNTNGKIELRNCNTFDRSIWKEGRLRFHNTSLADIVNELERKFDVKIILMEPQMEELRYTADFENEAFDEILSLLNIAYDFNISKNGNRYILSKSNNK